MFSDPNQNITQLGLQPGMKVADLGSGTGYYSLEAARLVGDKGRVFAVDIQKELLTRLRNNAHKQGVYNIEVVWGDLERLGGTKLREAFIDVVVASNVFFQLEDQKTLALEIKRILKPGGLACVIDWFGNHSNVASPHKSPVFTEESIKAIFEREGFIFERSFQAGSHHRGLLLRKKEER